MSTAITVYHNPAQVSSGVYPTDTEYVGISHHITNATFGTSPGDLLQLDPSTGKLPGICAGFTITIASVNGTTAEKMSATVTGNGTTDGTTINSYLAQGYSVELMSNSFFIDVPIQVMHDGQHIRGEGIRQTLLYGTFAGDMLRFMGVSNNYDGQFSVRGVVIEDLTMRGGSAYGYSDINGANCSMLRGINGLFSCDLTLRNIEVLLFKNIGVQLMDENGHDCVFEGKVWIHDCGNQTFATSNYYSGMLKIGAEWLGTTLANSTGTVTEAGTITGFNTCHCTVLGTCTVTMPTGCWGWAISGTTTITGSPQRLNPGANTVHMTGVTGTFYLALETNLTFPIVAGRVLIENGYQGIIIVAGAVVELSGVVENTLSLPIAIDLCGAGYDLSPIHIHDFDFESNSGAAEIYVNYSTPTDYHISIEHNTFSSTGVTNAVKVANGAAGCYMDVTKNDYPGGKSNVLTSCSTWT